MRLWVEKLWTSGRSTAIMRQPLREAVSWKMEEDVRVGIIQVSLFVRLWVEKYFQNDKTMHGNRQPLREAVSWKRCWLLCCRKRSCQPLREAVSWKIAGLLTCQFHNSQPLREAVSWKRQLNRTYHSRIHVSLFVRLWVEKYNVLDVLYGNHGQPLREAVSWKIVIIPKL